MPSMCFVLNFETKYETLRVILFTTRVNNISEGYYLIKLTKSLIQVSGQHLSK